MIKKIDVEDIAECVSIIKESFMTVANDLGFTAENAPGFTAFSTTEEKLISQMENEHRLMYAYYDGGRIVGYYSLAILENCMCELNNLCVLPAYRHKGIGEQLLNHALNLALTSNYKKMCIGIVEENQVLRRWYELMGFTHTSTKKFDFFPFTCGYMERNL